MLVLVAINTILGSSSAMAQHSPMGRSSSASQERTASSEVDGLRHKGWVVKFAGRLAESEALQRRALAVANKYLTEPHQVSTKAAICMDISECLFLQKKYKEALEEADQAIAYMNKFNDNARWRCMNDLMRAKCYVSLKEYQKAEPLLIAVIQKSKSDPSKEAHFDSLDVYGISDSQRLLATCYAAKGANGKAESLFKESMQLPEAYVSAQSPARLETLEAYLEFLKHNKRHGDAVKIAERISAIKAKPHVGRMCGTAMAQDRRWMEWKPSPKFDPK